MSNQLTRSSMLGATFLFCITITAGCSGNDPAVARHFDGKTDVILQVGPADSIPEYTIDVKLRTQKEPVDSYEIGDASPPMPFRIGWTAVYLNPEGYNVRIRNSEKDVVIGSVVGEPHAFTRITIVGGSDGIVVYVNGGEVARTVYPAPLGGAARIGAGYRERFWRGDIAYFDVYDEMKTLGEFAPSAERFDERGRIVSLPVD